MFIQGTPGDDVLIGTADDDIIAGLEGNDSIDGGDGFDLADYVLSPGGIEASLITNIVSDGSGGTDTLMNIEGIVGSDFGDTIEGDLIADRILGQGGDDTITGGNTNNNDEDFGLLSGGDGDDIMTGIGAVDMRGGAGNDSMVGIAIGDDAIDFIKFVYKEDPSGIIANLTDTANGGLAGGSVAGGYLIADGHGGIDTVSFGHVLRGSLFDDEIYVDDTWQSSFGNWIEVRPDAGDDVVVFDNVDTARISYRFAEGGALVDMVAGTATDMIPGDSAIGNDTFTGANEFRGSAFTDEVHSIDSGATLIRGDGDDDLLFGGSFVNAFSQLWGESGNDQITGTGDVRMEGGAGDDTIRGISTGDFLRDFARVSYRRDDSSVVANLTSTAREGLAGGDSTNGYLVADGFGGIDNVAQVHVFEDSQFDDLVFVDSGFTNSFGNWVEVRLRAGDDQVTFEGVATARISYTNANGAVLADMEAGTATDRNAGDASIGSDMFTGANELRGSNFDDLIFGQEGDDKRLRGHNGDDEIDARGGNDLVQGEAGNDTLTGGTGNDTVDGGSGDDTVIDAGTGGAVGSDGLDGPLGWCIGKGNGNGRPDRHPVFNETVDDYPGKGRGWEKKHDCDPDTGVPDNDVYTGGSGADTFIFGIDLGMDEITDFSAAQDGDVIDLSAFGLSGLQDVMDLTTDQAEGALIAFDIDNSLKLTGVFATDFTEDAFLFS